MVLVVRRDEVEQCLRVEPAFPRALETLEDAFRGFGLPDQVVGYRDERTRIQYPPEGRAAKDLWIMPMYVPAVGCAAMRIGAGEDSVIAVYDFEYMGIQGMLQDSPLAAVCAGLPLVLAAQHLAKHGARTLGCLGGGPALTVAVAATVSALPIEEVSLHEAATDGEAVWQATGTKTRRASTVEEVVRGADVLFISNERAAAELLRGAWLHAGQLVAAVDWRTLPRDAMAETTVVYASRRRAGVETDEGIELGEVIRGERPRRGNDHDVVVFASQPDIGFVDVATAWWCYRVARERGLGVDVPLAPVHAAEAASL